MNILSWLFGDNNRKSNLRDKKAQLDSLNATYNSFFAINEQGQEYEKKGDIDKAIKTYEVGLSKKTDTPFTYKRLAILYRKKKDKENELRAINSALRHISKKSAKYKWFANRKEKLLNS